MSEKEKKKEGGEIRNTTEEGRVCSVEEAVDRISIDIEHSTVQQGKNILDFVTVLAYPSLPSAISLYPLSKYLRIDLHSLSPPRSSINRRDLANAVPNSIGRLECSLLVLSRGSRGSYDVSI